MKRRVLRARGMGVGLAGERYGTMADEPAPRAATPVVPPGLVPAMSGRRLNVEEFAANAPEKLELIDGKIPGGENLLLLLVTSLGLRRAVMFVGS